MATASTTSRAEPYDEHDSRGGPPVAWKYRYQVSSPITRLCPCSTVAGLKTGMQESKELYPSARWMADPGRRARHPVQGSNTVLSDGEILASVVRLSYEATTSSTLCRRRSVWQEGLTDTATTTTSAMSTPSDKLACGQRYDVDIGLTEYMGSDAIVPSPCESSLLPLFYLSRMCDSGSSALFFCEISYQLTRDTKLTKEVSHTSISSLAHIDRWPTSQIVHRSQMLQAMSRSRECCCTPLLSW